MTRSIPALSVKSSDCAAFLMASAIFFQPSPSEAAERISLALSGYSKWWVVGVWSESATPAKVNADIKGDNEIQFVGSGTLDNGMTIGVKIELEAGGHSDLITDPIDKSYVWLESGIGKLELGSDYNAASLLHISAPEAAGLWNGPPNGVMSDFSVPRPKTVNTMYSGNQTELDHDDNAEKILFFTPSVQGVSLALSYTPASLSEDDRFTPTASDLWAAGLLVERTISGVAVGLSIGWLTGQVNSAADTTRERVNAVSVGTYLSYAGWSIGGSFGSDRHAYPGRPLTSTTTDSTGRSWDLGLMYEKGPARLSVDTYRSATEGLVQVQGKDRVTVTQVSGKYTLREGVALMGAVAHIDYDDEASSVYGNRGWSIMTGLGLWF